MKGEAVAIGIGDPGETAGWRAQRSISDRYFLREEGFQCYVEVGDF
jgi:hypothetical protein